MLYSHFHDYTNFKVLVQNDANRAIQKPRNYRLGNVTEVPYKNCFAISVGYNVGLTPPISPLLFHKHNGITIPSADEGLEIDLPNGIKIYRDGEAVEELTQLVNKYFTI